MSALVNPPTVRTWLAEPLSLEVRVALRRLTEAPDVQHVAVMPDVHLAEDVCIGCVMATEHLIYPDAVGGDIGCGMATMAFDCGGEVINHETGAGRLLAALYRVIPFNRHGRPSMKERLPEALAESPLSTGELDKLKDRDGRVQFGTLGRGNHFLEFQGDDQGQLWAMVHSGSRAMGQAIRRVHLARAEGTPCGLRALDANDPAGRAYLADAAWAQAYAKASRQEMLDAAARAMRLLFKASAVPDTYLDCDHNHVSKEEHFGRWFWVHRKGAMSADEGAPGILPGTMGTKSFHVEGRGCSEALRSSSHGAGRRMRRAEARQRVSARELHRQLAGLWFDHRAMDRLREEAPAAYKDIDAVLRAQKDLTRVVRILRPLLNYRGT